MLGDYINEYAAAKKNGDEKKMQQIEKDLASLGMDKHTLLTILKEMKTEE